MRATTAAAAAAAGVWLAAILCVCVAAAAVDASEREVSVTLDADASVSHTPHGDALVDWAAATTAGLHDAYSAAAHNASIASDLLNAFLVIGIKTSLLDGVAARDAIRATWGRRAWTRSLGVTVLFLGCQPDLSTLSEADRALTLQRIALEKNAHGDLLTDELRCVDSPAALVDKTVEFMNYTETILNASLSVQETTPTYVMVANDDVYVRLDGFVAMLQSGALPRERLYAGNAATDDQREPTPPERDPSSRDYLPIDLYPMSELPPFVAGAHYVVSRDVTQFVARNRDDLVGLGGLDDVTMALWMLALQIHPTFLDRFQLLRRDAPCASDVLSYADLSPLALRQIHANLETGRDLCTNLSYDAWGKQHEQSAPHRDATAAPDQPTATPQEPPREVTFHWDLQHDPPSGALHIQVVITAAAQRAELTFVPSAGPYATVFCPQLLSTLHAKLGVSVGMPFCVHHRLLLQSYLADRHGDSPALRAKMAIARHNLERAAADEASARRSPMVTIAFSAGASYARVLVECLFVQAYAGHYVVAVDEHALAPHAPPPDVFVFSILDDGKTPIDTATQPGFSTGAVFVGKYGPTSRLLMVSGEVWPTHRLHPRVTLLSTVEAPRHTRHLYVPFASSVFGEMVRHHPLQLLQAQSVEAATPGHRFCAYMYANCARAAREYMFDLLNDAEPVDALGMCQGTRREPDEGRRASRTQPFFSDAAVDIYRGYQFVIAFENAVTAPGYVTEKIVTAFLAGSVPVYLGHSATARRLFNARAFINCGDFESLKDCADHVRSVRASPAAYDAMRREPPVANTTAFLEAFSWHPDVLEMLRQRQQQRERETQVTPLQQLTRTLSEQLQTLLEQQ